MVTTDTLHLLTLPDRYGAPLADYYYLPDDALLYVRWHGQLTADEVIEGVKAGAQWRGQHAYHRVLNDKRDTGGDWSDALPWLQYEWLPQAVAAGLRDMAYIFPPDFEARFVSREFVLALRAQLNIALFTNEADAQRWLRAQ